jgi:ABC-type nitrate/sulfonate/bicarbonate transport system permease component
MRRWLAPVLLLAVLIGLWQVAADTGALAKVLGLEDFLVPSPSQVATTLWEDRSLLADNAWVTLKEVVLGFLCALAVGLAFAVALHLSQTLRRALYPLLVASQTVPVIVIAPILIVWFGYGLGPKLGIIALICFFPITVNTLDGLRSVDPEAIKMMRTLDASRWQILRRVEAPAALPFAFSGAKIAVAVAVIGAVFGEWSGASEGLGYLLLLDNNLLETARMFASVFILSAMAIALFGLLALAERRFVRWR